MARAEVPSSKRRIRSARERSTAKPGKSTKFLRDAATANVGKCETLVVEILASEDSNRSVELETILRRWMSLEEPKQLLERLDKMTKGKIWQRWSGPVFNAWVATDYTRAMAIPEKPDKFNHVRKIAAIEHLDPNFADYLKLADSSSSENADFTQALRVLGRDHPELASTLSTLDLEDAKIRAAMDWVAGGWASSDPASALAWVQGLKLGTAESGRLLSKVFGEWSCIDRSAARNAMTASGYDESTFGQLGGIHSLPAELTGLLAPVTPTTEIQLGLSNDPFLDVAGLYEKLEVSGIDLENLGYLMPAINHDGWYCPDPVAAATEVEKLPPGKLRDFMFKTIGDLWSAHDPEAGRAFAEKHGVTSPYSEVFPDPALRAAAHADPQLTFAPLLASSGNLGEGRGAALQKLASEWMDRDPKAAADWVTAGLEAPESDGPAIVGHLWLSNLLGYGWANRDAIGATDWLDSLPDSPLKSTVWKAMSEYTGQYSPDLEFQLYAQLVNDSARMPMLTHSLLEISRTIGEPAALDLLESPDLSPEEFNSLREALRNAAASNPSNR